MTDYDVTPEQASHGRVIPNRDLPMVAAQWLVAGYDSPLLREMASLTSRQALEGEVRLADVLAELGYPLLQVHSPYEELPWRGQWEGIWWAVDRMDRTHRPYASAQYVLEIVGDHEDPWGPGGGEALMGCFGTGMRTRINGPRSTSRSAGICADFARMMCHPSGCRRGRANDEPLAGSNRAALG